MKFDWDDAKARSNLIKHRVAFDVAIKAFDDPQSLSVPDRMVGGEERWVGLGSPRCFSLHIPGSKKAAKSMCE